MLPIFALLFTCNFADEESDEVAEPDFFLFPPPAFVFLPLPFSLPVRSDSSLFLLPDLFSPLFSFSLSFLLSVRVLLSLPPFFASFPLLPLSSPGASSPWSLVDTKQGHVSEGLGCLPFPSLTPRPVPFPRSYLLLFSSPSFLLGGFLPLSSFARWTNGSGRKYSIFVKNNVVSPFFLDFKQKNS